MMKTSPEKAKQKLYSNVTKQPNGCWEWNGTRLPKGYGLFRVLGHQYAHRVSFVLHYGPLFSSMVICHKCDNPPCVNPGHLFLGTSNTNNQDMIKKGRSKKGKNYKTHCPQGHKYNADNIVPRKTNARNCLICHREQSRRAMQCRN